MSKYRLSRLRLAMTAAALLAAGCQRDEVVEYTAPKETVPATSNIRQQLREAHAGMGAPPHPHEGGPGEHSHPAPGLRFEVPDGWEEQPLSSMRQASFMVGDEPEKFVDISVMSFPGDTGGVHANINRWREQIGLDALDAEDIDQKIDRQTINGNEYQIIDISRNDDGSAGSSQRIIGAIHGRGDQTWFFKMMGHDELTAAQKEPFLQFLASVYYE